MSNSGWRILLEEKEKALRECAASEDYPVPDGRMDERMFMSYFDRFCELSKERLSPVRQLQLSNKFSDSWNRINEISEGIRDFASGLRDTEDNGRLESLIRKISLTALEIGYRRGAAFEEVINFQTEFHNKVPRLAKLVSTLDRWPRSKLIQENLKTIYQTFIKLYMEIINAYKKEILGPKQRIHSIPRFQAIIKEAEESFSEANAAYNRNVQIEERSNSSKSRNTSSESLIDFKFEFETLERIGRGSHGKVYSVKEKTTEVLYARKDIPTSKTDDVQQEILALRKLRHTHIVTILAYSHTETGVRILMEPLAEHDLKQFMINCAKEGFPSDKTKLILSWFGCLLHALKFAHSNCIKHRDIKLGNILVKGSHVYLSDFSLAKHFTEESSVAKDETSAGTLRYRAPETRNNAGGGRKADVFSLGCVYAEMLTVFYHRPYEKLGESCKAEHKTDIFRDSLPAVVSWLKNLTRNLEDEKEISNMCKTIRNMILEELGMRHTADEALKSVEEIHECRCVHVR